MKKKEKIIKEREKGASLPPDLRKEYKEYLYNEQQKEFERKQKVLKAMVESVKNGKNDFKSSMISSVEIDHQKAQANADKERKRNLDKKIASYIEEKGLSVKDVKVISVGTNIQLCYVNESGEIIRENIDISKLQEK